MADAFYSHQDYAEGQEKEGNYGMTMTMDEDMNCRPGSPEESMSLLSRLEKYADSDNIFNRQIVVRSLLEALRTTTTAPGTSSTVLTVMNHLSDDTEPSVRAELMEQVPHIAMFCQEYQNHLADVTSLLLLPVVVKYLMDPNNQVRKTSQAALLVLLEQDLVSMGDIEEQVCPVVLRLTETDSFDDFRTEAVALICKMAPLLGREMTEKSFLARFAALCTDALFHVRKVCAANFGDFCCVVGLHATEETLVPRFADLCEDGVWGVRKACADVSTQVSCSCTPEVRRTHLAPLFLNLLRDQSRWVRMAAYQALGSFISTFADPNKTGIYMSEEGLRVVQTSSNMACHTTETTSISQCCTTCQTLCNPIRNGLLGEDELELESLDINRPLRPKWPGMNCTVQRTHDAAPACTESVPRCLMLRIDDCDNFVENGDSAPFSENSLCTTSTQPCIGGSPDDAAFNSFNFWRNPIPDVELDVDIVGSALTTKCAAIETILPTCDPVITSVVQPCVQLAVNEETSRESLPVSHDSLDLLSRVNNLNLSDDVHKPSDQAETSDVMQSANQSESSSLSRSELNSPGIEIGTNAITDSIPVLPVLPMSAQVSEVQNPSGFQEYSIQNPFASDVNHGGCAHNTFFTDDAPLVSFDQTIVPEELLKHYLSMSDPVHDQTIDSEIVRHCAYSLPAVAMTLGRKNWPLIKELYETLASDMQWKVRRTLAFSIHEIAMIIGEELAMKDLVPVFNGFLKDLDEVRIGVLHHLRDFLQFLRPHERRFYLPKLSEFLKPDNDRNWRFRLELTEQLGLISDLFCLTDIHNYLMPIAINLVADKVAQVRQAALRIVSILLRVMSLVSEPPLIESLLKELAQQFAHHKKWIRRQTFVLLSSQLLQENALSTAHFTREVLPILLDLSYDPVPNVRLSVAKTLRQALMPQENSSNRTIPYQQSLVETLQRLTGDQDRDVRFYAKVEQSTFDLVPPV